ncbi:ankyrin repeat-containing domain protein [Mycena metata]|uniref:Ankyrin repeat-containing domain protein n=1 Tax=Mycena metata TaxID=1033252 RepID=A0AAD7JJX0_9AGAR|nr:ankyrin repeat-containing domain protein [Mycena metata]
MYNGGLSVTREMNRILSKPGYISLEQGGQTLRELYRRESVNLNPLALSPFALSVFTGHLSLVREAVEKGAAPDLMGSETPFKTGYASLAILGAQRVTDGPRGSLQFRETLEYLFSKGLPPDVEDIVGFTALHHATTSPVPKDDLTRCLLDHGANVNHRSRYGEISLLGCMQLNLIPTIDILMEYGADLDIPDADGWTARKHFLSCGPQVTATITKWIRKRTGGEAPRAQKCCDTCGKSDSPLKNCARCRIARYCSSECQAKAWKTHKKTCQPFSSSNTVTLKPYYESYGSTIPTADFTRKYMGYPTQASSFSNTQTRAAHTPKNLDRESKTLVLKVQVPYTGNPQIRSTGDLLLYTKKRDFACTIRRVDGPADYDRISEVVRTKGVGGAKAYFAAELESREKLVVKISESLAEQPW